MPDVIAGRNPVSEAVRSNRPIDKILVAKGEVVVIEESFGVRITEIVNASRTGGK